MTRDEALDMIVRGLHETFDIEPARITLATNLYTDLDIDSIDAVDLAVKMQKLTGKRMAPEVFKTVRTVGDLVDAIEALTRA
jgi:acyl carrier protein